MNKLRNNRKGLTLIELVVGVAAAGIVLAACGALLGFVFGAFGNTDVRYQSHQLALLVTGKIKNELQYNAGAVTLYTDAAKPDGDSVPYTQGNVYIYTDTSGRLVKRTATSSSALGDPGYVYPSASSRKYAFDVAFTKTTDKTVTVDVKVRLSGDTAVLYELKTDVIVNNGAVTQSGTGTYT